MDRTGIPAGVRARFDDLRAGTARAFGPSARTVVAWRPEDVVPALAEVEAATTEGRWAFGLVAYEAAAGLDPTLPRADPPDGVPLVCFGIGDAPGAVAPVGPGDAAGTFTSGPWVARGSAADHRRGVAAVRDHIAAGRTYQCNLTDRLDGPVTGDLPALYAALALAQRGAHNAYLDLGRLVVASASPELFLERRGDRLLLRPMKGTAPRGRTTAEDAVLAGALWASPKERAENVMIVDLMRNDASRVATTGSVRVEELFRLERFETVHQLTSDVTARLRPDVGLVDLFRALFPCGSVTGAPKRATMTVIDELEDAPRGVYCGAIGWVAPPGEPVAARFSVAIRTVVVDRERGTGTYGAGGGITWSSDPDAEHAELRTKARVLARRPEEFELLETMALVDDPAGGGRLRDVGRHLARVADSAAYFGFAFDVAAARAALERATVGRVTARVRLRVARSGAVAVDLAPLPAASTAPVRLVVDDEPIDAREPWPHHKTSRRAPYDRRRARHAEADDVVLVNERSEVTETCVASLAVRLDGTWWTPPLGSGALPGVARGRLVEAGELRERTVWPVDLDAAEALAVVSSLRGWRPAVLARPVAAG